ncbi:photo system II stability/assembly factor-like protein [Haloferula helveola]|uniref:Photo system II stability/assembly factor-like protein n=1 Tax=Haloferula helveola TaxID=490095 RepID=A0ABN6GZI1_9BACT|nr:photo system II stability/assembly factor-like protein [Haloferula helveola]
MSDRIDIGTRKGLFSYERRSSGWEPVGASFLGIQVPMLFHHQGVILASVEHGHFGTKFHRSADGGSSWEELDAPAYPEKPDDVPDILDPWRNTPVPWSLEKVWCLESAGRTGELWCGTLPGGLFRSSDQGESWSLVRSLWDRPERAKWAGGGYDWPGIHSICVHPDDPMKVAVAISCGGVWRTEDGGESWAQGAHGMRFDFVPEDQGGADPEAQDPHRMVQCPSAPDRLWVQHHCGIYRSDDGARSWHEIRDVKPSGFGFAVAVHPEAPDTAWFVPAKKDEFRHPVDARFVVTRTRDGGRTFETLERGLPETPAYDIVFRHALDVDRTGHRLAMGSTTGSLWVSEDQGDSWQHLSAHLPPIYCVRFA